MNQEEILKNYQAVEGRIAESAKAAGRAASDIKLVVVTKGKSITNLQKAYNVGIRIFGENYVQEAENKIGSFQKQADLEWHMIGHIQSRKAKQVSQLFNWIESLDSVKVARRVDHFSGETGKLLPVLLEFNVSGEGSKFGFPAWNQEKWPLLLTDLEQIVSLPNIEIRGLMTMPPLTIDPENARFYFEKLRKLQDFIRKNFPSYSWDELSMGMSSDYEIAVQEGATIVRIGTAIMGPRE